MRNAFKVFVPFLIVLLTVLSFAQADTVGAASKYAEGEHSLPFTVLKGDSDERSMTNDYLTSPAKLIVKDGKSHVQLTLKNSSWWQDFTVASGAVTTISEANDTRVVQFEVGDLDQVLNAKIHVIVPDIDYDNKYDVRFAFDASNIKANTGASADVKNTVNGENGDESVEKDANKVVEENPQTGDHAPILVFSMILLVSGLLIVRRLVVR